MKNEELLEKWEEVVKRVRHDGNKWRATKHSFICSKHFEKDDYIQPPTADAVFAGLKRMPYPHCSRLSHFHVTSQRKQKKRLQTECNKTPVYTGQKRARQQDTPQSAKVLINKNYEKVFRVGSNDTEISNKQLKSKIRNLQQQRRRCKPKIANKTA